VLSILMWKTDTVLCSQILLLAIFYISSFIAMLFISKGTTDVWLMLSIFCFSSFILVLIIVLLLLSESLDGVDIFGELFGIDFQRKKKKV
jgi:hypothetical protein